MAHRLTPYANPILQYCGYPLTKQAIMKYGFHKIQHIIRDVRYCKHGDRCQKCCFRYRGNLKTSLYNWHTIQQVFFNFVHPWKKNRLIKIQCHNKRCVNIFHCNEQAYAPNIENYIQICQHGKLCRDCCWEWTRETRTPERSKTGWKLPTFRVTNRKRYYTQRYLAMNALLWHLPKGKAVTNSCNNSLCCNMFHVEVRRRNAKLLIATQIRKEQNLYGSIDQETGKKRDRRYIIRDPYTSDQQRRLYDWSA